MTRGLCLLIVVAATAATVTAGQAPFDFAHPSTSLGVTLSVSKGQGKPPRGDAERGRQLFVKTGCYQCHGHEAQGASTGPKLGPEAVPFARFAGYVRKPTGEMPPYTAKVLSDAQLADMYAFVTSRKKPGARPQLLRPPGA